MRHPRFRLSKKFGTVKSSQRIRSVLRNRKIGFCVPYFPILSLRGGRARPTRQSLTMRFVIPQRAMAGRNDAAYLMFFVIGISSCLVLPCFATGCHTSNFKIATAALRPRNDTKSGRLYLGNGRFHFMRPFCALSLRIVFQTFRFGNCSVFPQNLSDLSLRGGRVRPTRQSLTERFAIPERTMVARNETEP